MTRNQRSQALHAGFLAAKATGRAYYLVEDRCFWRAAPELWRGVRLAAIICMHDDGTPDVVRMR